MITARPTPTPTALSQPFWDACRDHRLTAQRCEACGTYVFIPQEFCPRCLRTELVWANSEGAGEIITYTVVGRAQTPAFDAPYIVAVVRLDEGYEMMTNVIGVSAEFVEIGARVNVSFVDLADGTTLPCFELAETPDAR